MKRLACIAALGALTAACGNSDEISEIPESTLHSRAATLALPQRYDLYLRVYRSRLPRNPVLAGDVAALGDPAWDYVQERALAARDAGDFQAALSVLAVIDRRCSPDELAKLQTRG